MSLKMMMVFSDKHSEEVGEHVAENLRRSLGDAFAIAQSRWNAELLRSPKLCDMAADDARESDIVIISTTEARTLPAELDSWIAKWSENRPAGPAALVALLNKNAIDACKGAAMERQLQRIAQQAHMDFFCQHEVRAQKVRKKEKKTTAADRVIYKDPHGKFEISFFLSGKK